MNQLKFLNEEHKKRFYECMQKSGSSLSNRESAALFYILTGNDDIWGKGIENIYDFKRGGILTRRALNTLCLCSSSRSLVLLAFNLYNGFTSKKEDLDPMSLFYSLDRRNYQLALDAIKIRFCK